MSLGPTRPEPLAVASVQQPERPSRSCLFSHSLTLPPNLLKTASRHILRLTPPPSPPLRQDQVSMAAPRPQSAGRAIPVSSPQSPTKELRNLRLPSFSELGIAFPHPDWESSHSDDILAGYTRPLATPGKDNDDDFVLSDWPASSHPTPRESVPKSPFESIRTILTPPEEAVGMAWSTPRYAPIMEEIELAPTDLLVTQSSRSRANGERSPERLAYLKAALGSDANGWIEEVALAAITESNAENFAGTSMKMLSHALPSPSVPGHAFSAVISSLRTQLPSPLVWINLLHAVPGRFNLADLPSSPPATPGMPLSGEDYFTTRVFDQAVPAIDFERGVSELQPHSSLLAPPGSLDLVLVERYIPPPSVNEFVNLFNPRGSSLVTDRLVELSDDNGCLVFIYPTRTGATTFVQDYLGPIIDPILRAMVVVNGFSADLGAALGRMEAVEHLHEFASMNSKMQWLCRELSGDSNMTKRRLHGASSTFTLAYAAKHQVKLDGKVWSDWWVKQEKPRVRAVIGKYFRQARRLPVDAEIMPVKLIQEVLDGVSTRAPQNHPETGVEMGVFVVRRNKRA